MPRKPDDIRRVKVRESDSWVYHHKGFHGPQPILYRLDRGGKLIGPYEHPGTNLLHVTLVPDAPPEEVVLRLFEEVRKQHGGMPFIIRHFFRPSDGAAGYVGYPQILKALNIQLDTERFDELDVIAKRLGATEKTRSAARRKVIEDLIRERFLSLTEQEERVSSVSDERAPLLDIDECDRDPT